MTRFIKIRYAIATVFVVFILAYAFLYTTDSYKTASAMLKSCASVSTKPFAIINPLLTTVRRSGENGSAEYTLALFGEESKTKGGTVSLTRTDGSWKVRKVLIDTKEIEFVSCGALPF